MMELSVIIPAYNVENYLTACIESVMNNTFQNFEILLVDDGSTDRTGALADELAETYAKIKVFHTENRGIAEARNLGLEHACGERVCFIDSDDVIAANMLQTMVDAMGDDVQLVMCGLRRCTEKDAHRESVKTEAHVTATREETARQIILHYGANVCNKMFRRSIMEEHSIRFRRNCRISEDTYFIWEYVQYCTNSVMMEERFYQYIVHENSLMNTFRNTSGLGDRYEDLPRSWKYCTEVVERISPELEDEAASRAAMFYQTVLRKLKSPSEAFIGEARAFVRTHLSSLHHFQWGWKYYLSGLLLCASYNLWAAVFRRA